MKWNDKNEIRVAILDLYEGQENQGMRCVREIINLWGEENHLAVTTKEFDVRLRNEVPSTDFDIYISTGGPGSPLESEGSEWEKYYFDWLEEIHAYNDDEANSTKKHVFFICHSYQLACRYYKVGNVCKRKSTAFGVFPVHITKDGGEELIFEGLNHPFYAVDSRDFQVIEPDMKRLKSMGAKLLALEKERPHVPLERAIMAIRFSDYFIGTQFHPEADAIGMSMYLQREDKKKTVIENYGEEKWKNMLEHLDDPGKIKATYKSILPNFLNYAVGELVEA
jgi:homoserine O-succinyltransferase/O-acetyltransferase